MILPMILVPAAAGGLAMALPWNGPRRTLLVLTALAHAAGTAAMWLFPAEPVLEGWMAVDEASLIFLTVISGLFLAASVYAAGYLARSASEPTDSEAVPEGLFTACLLWFLGTMTLVVVSRHLGLLWVAVEATTLASAPLIGFHRNPRSLEATWKYLLVCSVGIALALLGNFFLAVAAHRGETSVHLTLDALVAHAGELDPTWLRAAFLLLLVGYGTKMGLAPLHTWLPDAHSEAPSFISALLSGALLNCAFLGILRVQNVLAAAGLAAFGQELLVLFGLLSLALAAVFILGQADYKRMLAYSSVEHMGVLSLGVGLGGMAGFGAMLHAVNHSLAKAMLFLLAGNILARYHTKSTTETQGVLRSMPQTGPLWLMGFLAISGSPPFGLFASELTILQGAIDQGRYAVAAAYLAGLAVVFVGMATIVLRMAYGEAPREKTGREAIWSVLPPAALGLATLVLGVWVPPPLTEVLKAAAAVL